MNLMALWIALGVFLLSFLFLLFIGKKKKTWYRVYLANPEMSEEHVYRTFWDKLWISDWSGVMLFRTQDGRAIRVGKHWIVKITEV